MFKSAIGVGVALLLVVPHGAIAAGEDLQNCLYNNGKLMSQQVCESLRRAALQKEELRRIQDEISSRQKAEYDARRAEEALERDRQEQELKRIQAEQAEQQRQRVERAKLAEEEGLREYRAQEAAAAQREASRRSACGSDYRVLSIGMTIERAKQCVAPFRLTGQINRKDGVVSTYRAGGYYAHVMGGRIVSWGR